MQNSLKGYIDENGVLVIHRAKDLDKKQSCPYDAGESYCGDWCPLFGEVNCNILHIYCGSGNKFEITKDERKK